MAEASEDKEGKVDDPALAEMLAGEGDFRIRRAVERLREGLFDPVAVRLLTAHEEKLRAEIEQGMQALEEGRCPHLCIVGAYGQGKSHCLVYLQDLALRAGFATSLINLDPREIPFHNFRTVYRELLSQLLLPGANGSFPACFQTWAAQQTQGQDDPGQALLSLLPDEMPHLFKAILAAMASDSRPPAKNKKSLPPSGALLAREIPRLLGRALKGEPIPVPRLSKIFKYRQVSFYKDGPLSCRGPAPFLQMTRALAALLRQMGYRGWMLLFDEGEAIAQGTVTCRRKSYPLLHELFRREPSKTAADFLYPVFAFTDDFFARLQAEDYERVQKRGETTIPYFERNYGQEWRHLTTYRLADLSKREWQELARKLACLHGRAYGWSPPAARMASEMAARLEAGRGQETRLKLKSLVDCLDLVLQEQVL